MVDIKADDIAVRVQVDVKTFDDFPGLGAGDALQLDVEAVRLRIVMQLHGVPSRKLRSKNALWTVSPSSSVTTLRKRGRASSAARILPQKRIRPSCWISRRIGAASTSVHHSL